MRIEDEVEKMRKEIVELEQLHEHCLLVDNGVCGELIILLLALHWFDKSVHIAFPAEYSAGHVDTPLTMPIMVR